MTTPASDQTEVDKLSLVVSFEGVHGILVDIHAYVFDPSGELVARQTVRKGQGSHPCGLASPTPCEFGPLASGR